MSSRCIKKTDERKKAHQEQVARQELDKERAEQSWKQERQLSQAAGAYGANVILETPAGGIAGVR